MRKYRMPIGFAESRISKPKEETSRCCELLKGEGVLSGTIADYSVELGQIERSLTTRYALRISRRCGPTRITTVMLPGLSQVLVRRTWSKVLKTADAEYKDEAYKDVKHRLPKVKKVLSPSFFCQVSAIQKGDWICFPFYRGIIPESEVTAASPVYRAEGSVPWANLRERLASRPGYTLQDGKLLVDPHGLWYPITSLQRMDVTTAYFTDVDSVGSVIVDRIIVRVGIRGSSLYAKDK